MDANWVKFFPKFIRKSIAGRALLQTIFSNSLWLFFDKLFRIGVGLIVNAWVARYLGPEKFGDLSYAIAFALIINAIASLGLPGIVVRDLVRYPERYKQLLSAAFALRLVGALLCIVIALVFTLSNPENDQINSLILIIIFGTVFQSFDVIDYWFQSKLKNKYVVFARNFPFFLLAVVKLLLIFFGAPVEAFAVAVVLEIASAAFFMWVMFKRAGGQISILGASFGDCINLLKEAWPLVLTGLSVGVYMRIDQVMLGEMINSSALGVFSAATKISEVWYLVPTILISVVAPILTAKKKENHNLFLESLAKIFVITIRTGLLVVLLVMFSSKFIVYLLYGQSFAGAEYVLMLHIWTVIFVAIGVVSGVWFINEGLQKFQFYQSVFGACASIFFNYVLIPIYGAVGAAIAAVLSQLLTTIVVNILFKETRPLFYLQIHALQKIFKVPAMRSQ